jgi:acyl carrier protein
MKLSESPATTPAQLARFYPEVIAAYSRYAANGDAEAVETIVLAALADFTPQRYRLTAVPADDRRLIQDLGYDSLAVAEAVFFLEDLFDVKIGNRDLVELQTVGQLRRYVVAKLAGKPSTAGRLG